jgi:hypothetical protein
VLDPETVALLRAILDELCASTSPSDMSIRANIASKLLEAARQGGDTSIGNLEAAGKEALLQAPTMWR